MLTSWAKKVFNLGGQTNVIPTCGTIQTASITAKHYDGTDIYIAGNPYAQPWGSFVAGAVATESAGIVVGSGDTAASENDYVLANKITSGLSATVAQSTAYDSETDKTSAYSVITLTNSTGSDIVIKEIGCYAVFGTATELGGTINTGGGRRKCALIDRTVLETPVTVPANGNAVIRYSFIFN